MPRQVFANNAESTLAGAISTSATAITVQSGHGALFPALSGGDWAVATLIKLVGGLPQREIVRVTARSGDTLTILRAQEGTAALTFSAGDTVRIAVTAAGMNDKAELANPAFVGLSNTGKSDMKGSTTALAARLPNIVEKITRVAAAASGTINLDVTTQSIMHYTVAATGNWTINVRGNSANTLNSLMDVDDTVTVTMWAEQGATAYRPTTIQVDGATITPRWLGGGGAPAAGNVSSLDLYTLTITKTGSAAFAVLASQGTAK